MHMAGKKCTSMNNIVKQRRPAENYWSVDAELHLFAPESVHVKKHDFLALVFVSVVENVTLTKKFILFLRLF